MTPPSRSPREAVGYLRDVPEPGVVLRLGLDEEGNVRDYATHSQPPWDGWLIPLEGWLLE